MVETRASLANRPTLYDVAMIAAKRDAFLIAEMQTPRRGRGANLGTMTICQILPVGSSGDAFQNLFPDGFGLIEVSVAGASAREDLGSQFDEIPSQIGIDVSAVEVRRQLYSQA